MSGIRNILVPLDGSALAERAVPLAVGIAARRRATVRLVTVDVPQPLEYMAGVPAYAVVQHEADCLESIRRRALALPGEAPPIVTALVRGPVSEALLRYAEDNEVDLIVMTTRGHPAPVRAWIGDIEDEIVRRALVPVLLDRPRAHESDWSSARRIERVVVALDGSPRAEAILEHALAVGGREAAYDLLQLLETPGALPVEMIEAGSDEQAGALEYLGRVAQRLREQGYRATAQVVAGHDAAWGIADYATSCRADLVALTTRGWGGLGAVPGRVAERVLRTTHVPLLIYRPRHS